MRFRSLFLPIFVSLIPIMANAVPNWDWVNVTHMYQGPPVVRFGITYTIEIDPPIQLGQGKSEVETYLRMDDGQGYTWKKRLGTLRSEPGKSPFQTGDYNCIEVGFVDSNRIFLACEGTNKSPYAMIHVLEIATGNTNKYIPLGNNQFIDTNNGYWRAPLTHPVQNNTGVISVSTRGNLTNELYNLDLVKADAVSLNANGLTPPSAPPSVPTQAGTHKWEWHSAMNLQMNGGIQAFGWKFTVSEQRSYRNIRNQTTDYDAEYILHAENAIGVKWQRTLSTEYVDPSGQKEINGNHHCKEIGFINANRIFLACDGTDNNPTANIFVVDLVTGGDQGTIDFPGLRNFEVNGYLRPDSQAGYFFPVQKNVGVVGLSNSGSGSMQANVHFYLNMQQEIKVPFNSSPSSGATAPAATARPFEIRLSSNSKETHVTKTDGQENFWELDVPGIASARESSLLTTKDWAFVATVIPVSPGKGYGVVYQIDLITGDVVHEISTLVRDNDRAVTMELVDRNIMVSFGIGGYIDAPYRAIGEPCIRFLHYKDPKKSRP